MGRSRALLLCALLLATPAAASPERWVLFWTSDGACIQAKEIAASVEAKLGRHVFEEDADVTLEGKLERLEGEPRWRARLAVVDRLGKVLGTREVNGRGDSCRELDPALTLVLALMIDPDAVQKSAEASSNLPTPPLTNAELLRKPFEVSFPAASRGWWRIENDLSAAGALGFLHGPAPGLRTGAWFAPPERWAFETFGSFYMLVRGPLVSLAVTVAATSCPLVADVSGWRFSGCAGLELGVFVAGGDGLAEPDIAAAPVANVIAHGRVSVPVGRWLSVFATLGPSLALVRPRLVALTPEGGQVELYTAPWVQAVGELGVAFRIH